MISINSLAGILSTSLSSGVANPNPNNNSSQPFLLSRTGVRYARFKDALAAAVSGDVIKCAAGNYTQTSRFDAISIDTFNAGGSNPGIAIDTLTVEWETPGSPAVWDLSSMAQSINASGGEVAGFVMGPTCLNLTIRGFHIKGYRTAGYHGNTLVYALPGYPLPADKQGVVATLTVEDCKAWQHTNGIITLGNENMSVYLRRCVFEDCTADSLSHGLYISSIALLEVTGCTFKSTSNAIPQPSSGHLLKSRAKVNRIKGSYFDPSGGTARCMDISNGGNLEVVGNIIMHYGATKYADDNFPIAFGPEQRSIYFNPSIPNGNSTYTWVNDDRTHSVLLAQNTFKKVQPQSGPNFEFIHIYGVIDINQAPMTVSQTVRNNIVAGPSATDFVTAYPNNSEVSPSTISGTGVYSGQAIPGNPAISDAKIQYTGEGIAPIVRSDTYRGGRIVNGVSSSAPTWVTSVAVGSVGTVPNSTLSTSPIALPNASSIIDSWASAVLNTTGAYVGSTFVNGPMLVIWGGGHTISYDELYGLTLTENAGWNLLRGRTNPIIQNVPMDANGNPVTGHTYDGLWYDPVRNEMVRMGAIFRYSDISGDLLLQRYNFNKISPSFSGSALPWSQGAPVLLGAADIATYDSSTRRVWYRPSGNQFKVAYYDASTDTHTISTANKSQRTQFFESTGAIDKVRGLWLNVGVEYTFFRLNDLQSNDYYVPTLSGTMPATRYKTVLHDATADRFVIWADSGNTLYYMTPPSTSPYQGGNSWTITPVVFGGDSVVGGAGNGTYKRFSLVEYPTGERIYVILTSGSSPARFFRVA